MVRWIVALFVLVALSGCADEAPELDEQEIVEEENFRFQAGTGAIAGLLVDDRFRPIDLEEGSAAGEFQAAGFILVQETGRQYRTNENGEFQVLNLEPGDYTIRLQSSKHEATPSQVRVTAGEFADMNMVARRTSSVDNIIITNEYSIFIPCAADLIIATGTFHECVADLSGDSNRLGFDADFSIYDDVTAVISEIRYNQVGGYRFFVGFVDDSEFLGDTILYISGSQTDYMRGVNIVGEQHETGDIPFEPYDAPDEYTTGFFVSEYNVGVSEIGLGVGMGYKGQVIQSIFLGEPEENLDTYCTLC